MAGFLTIIEEKKLNHQPNWKNPQEDPGSILLESRIPSCHNDVFNGIYLIDVIY